MSDMHVSLDAEKMWEKDKNFLFWEINLVKELLALNGLYYSASYLN